VIEIYTNANRFNNRLIQMATYIISLYLAIYPLTWANQSNSRFRSVSNMNAHIPHRLNELFIV
jgi:hypothetical protein